MENNKPIIAISLLGFFLLTGAIFYLRENIFSAAQVLYKNFKKDFYEFQKEDIETIVNQFALEIFTPDPLRVQGPESNAVLLPEKITAQTNIQRYDNGMMPPLIENEQLRKAAESKVSDMFSKQYFEHVSPDGIGLEKLIRNHGYEYIVVGENLILGNFASEKELVQAWMDSPGHRANILHPRFSEIGVAIAKGSYKGETVWIAVQEFGLPFSACRQADATLKNQIEAKKAAIDELTLTIDQVVREIEQTNPRSEKYNELVNQYNSLVNEYNGRVQEVKKMIAEYNDQVSFFNQCIQGN